MMVKLNCWSRSCVAMKQNDMEMCVVSQHRNNNTVHPPQKNRAQVAAAPLPNPAQLCIKAACFAVAAIMLYFVLIGNAAAQAGAMLDSQEANTLYVQLLENPTDRSLNLKYSATMSRGGDYEAAIPPLERLLINEPNNAWLMLQLGTLYKALGSKNMAATYLNQAINEPTASSDVVQQSQQLLGSM